MDRTEMVKRAYAEGAFTALQQLGYEKNAAAEIAIKMAEGDDDGMGAGGGAGLGALGGAALGGGGAALASILMKKNLMNKIPGIGSKMQGMAYNARQGGGEGGAAQLKKLLARIQGNPTAASATAGGLGGAGLGALGGGLYGGLSD
jgi:hypothetical protein